MKTILMLFAVLFPVYLSAQYQIPVTDLRTPDGNLISSSTIFKTDQPCVVIFWKSNTRCCDNLDNMQTAWVNQLKDKGVKLIAICLDCKGSWSHVKPYINGKAWEFDIFIDVNGDFKRSMGVPDAPYTMLLDKNQNVVCRSSGYCSGDEEFVCRKILHCIDAAEGGKELQEIVRN